MRKQHLRFIRMIASVPVDLFWLAVGIFIYLLRKSTPPRAHLSLIRLFCLTGGYSNDWLSRVLAVLRPKYALPHAHGVLGDLDREDVRRIGAALRSEGYYVFEHRLPADLCDRLLDYALTQRCTVRPMDIDGQRLGSPRPAIYSRSEPLGTRYDFDMENIVNNKDVQRLFTDFSIIAVAQEYLGSQPVADVLGLWWHTAYSKYPDKEAAQFYHFDMDRIKWLKFFIYLTDVTEQSGPHTFVAGSHRTSGIPWTLRAKGYARLTDEEVEACYVPQQIRQFMGLKGTIIAEDTRGLHKGKHVEAGDRLMLQLQFSNSAFGATYSKAVMRHLEDTQIAESIKGYPRLYSIFAETPK